MIFSTFSFLLAFLPAVCCAYALALRAGRMRLAKGVLVLASLLFYALGSGRGPRGSRWRWAWWPMCSCWAGTSTPTSPSST